MVNLVASLNNATCLGLGVFFSFTERDRYLTPFNFLSIEGPPLIFLEHLANI